MIMDRYLGGSKVVVARIFAALAVLMAVIIVPGCGGDQPAGPSQPGGAVYTGEAEGGQGPVKVEVTVYQGEIQDIEVVEHNETPGLGDTAFNTLIPQIIEKQAVEGIDVWTGATYSSQALFQAVEEALSKS